LSLSLSMERSELEKFGMDEKKGGGKERVELHADVSSNR